MEVLLNVANCPEWTSNVLLGTKYTLNPNGLYDMEVGKYASDSAIYSVFSEYLRDVCNKRYVLRRIDSYNRREVGIVKLRQAMKQWKYNLEWEMVSMY